MPPITRRMAYWTLALLLLINLVNYIDRWALSAVLELINKDYEITDAQGGLLMTAFLVVYMLTSPLFGWLGDRWNRKGLIAFGIGLWSLATAGAAFTRSYGQLFFTRTLVGVGEASYATISPTLIADLFTKETRGRTLALFYVAIPIGSALGFILGGAIGGTFGWRAAFLIVGFPGLLLALAILFTKEPARGASDGLGNGSGHGHGKVRWKDVTGIARIPSYVWTTAGMTAMTFVMGGLAHWMPTYIARAFLGGETASHEELRKMLQKANFGFGAITCVAGLLGTFVGGWLADFWQKRNRAAYALVCGCGMLAGVPFAALAVFTSSLTVFWVAMFLCEFFLFWNWGPSNSILLSVVEPRIRATAFSVHILVTHALGDALSPFLIGKTSDVLQAAGKSPGEALGSALLLTPVVLAASGILYNLAGRHLSRDAGRALAAARA
ncbi:MAG: MFS transporter [Planctomycetes bacterium]|nr:MFS transporter [Planctomycetota bacterium]